MKKCVRFVFLVVCESNEEIRDACIHSIKELKNINEPMCDVTIDVFYVNSDDHRAVRISDFYINNIKNKNYDYVIIMRDSVCIVEEMLLKRIIDIFSANVSLGVLGVKGYIDLDDKIDENKIYGGCYYLSSESECVLKQYRQPLNLYEEVKSITGNFMVLRGEIPVMYDVTMEILAEMVSVAAVLQGYTVGVSRQDVFWCLETDKENTLTREHEKIVDKEFKIAEYAINSKRPLLTIGIPTYNRSKFLNKCLNAIYNQIGNYSFIEVLVSNNASCDDTESVINKYGNYDNLRYVLQKENIGGDNNVRYIYEHAQGDFVIVCGDDDYYYYGSIMRIIKSIYDYPDTAAIELSWWGNSYETYCGEGIDDFVNKCAKVYTSISSFAINRRYYMELPNRNKFVHTCLNQVYVQLAILTRHRHFCYLEGANFSVGSGEASYGIFPFDKRVDFSKIFIDQYYSILNYFLGKGLTIKGLSSEKYRVANWALIRLQEIAVKQEHTIYKMSDDMEEIFKKHYSKELYYDSLVYCLAKIREIDRKNKILIK